MNADLVVYGDPRSGAVEKQLDALAPRFRDALAGLLDEQRLIQSIMVALDRNRQLLKCDPQSILMAAMSAACVGLEVDGVMGQAFLVPFNVKGRGLVAQFMTGYKGYNTLAARGSYVVTGDVVREGDDFEYDKADGVVAHKPQINSDRPIRAAWARARSNQLPAVIEVVGIDELMELRSRSKSMQGEGAPFSPWLDPKVGFPAMCAKTPKRRLQRSLPLGTSAMQRFAIAARIDEISEEQGLPAWATPERGVETGAAGRTEAPPRDAEPITLNTSNAFPELTPDMARKATSLVDFIKNSESVGILEKRWCRKETMDLRTRVEIMSKAAIARIERAHSERKRKLEE